MFSISWITPSRRRRSEFYKHIGHKHHLCDLVKRGELTLEHLKEFIKSSNYICKKCGRTAKAASNLCEPVIL